MSEKEAAADKIELIHKTINGWLDWDKDRRTAQGHTTNDDTHFMSFPVYPSHGALRNWVENLEEVENLLRELHD